MKTKSNHLNDKMRSLNVFEELFNSLNVEKILCTDDIKKKNVTKRSVQRNDYVITSASDNTDQLCDCYPRTLLIPAFITNSKFNSFIDRITAKN